MPYKDPETRRLHDRIRYAQHREKITAYHRLWRQAHPEKVRAYEQRRPDPAKRRAACLVYYRTYRLKHAAQIAAARKRGWPKAREKRRAWNLRNHLRLMRQARERRRARLGQYRTVERLAARRRRQSWTPEQHAAHARHRERWRQNNRSLVQAIGRMTRHRRRARLRTAVRNDLTTAQERLVRASKRGVCAYCPAYNPGCTICKKGAHTLTIDHITAVFHRGDNTLWNVTACCTTCNSKKGTNPPPLPVQPMLL